MSVSLEVNGVDFTRVTGCETFGSETEVVEHKIVDQQGREIIAKIPGRTKLLNIVCTANLTSGKTIADWRKQVEDGQIATARKDGAIVLRDAVGQEVARYNFTDGWPSSLKVKWDGAASTTPVTETVSIVIEGLTRQ